MTVDPALPGQLRSAAARVQAVQNKVAHVRGRAVSRTTDLSWHSPAATRHRRDIDRASDLLSEAVGSLTDLVRTLEQSARLADERLDAERAAAKAAAARSAENARSKME